jgi:hypothetical protein
LTTPNYHPNQFKRSIKMQYQILTNEWKADNTQINEQDLINEDEPKKIHQTLVDNTNVTEILDSIHMTLAEKYLITSDKKRLSIISDCVEVSVLDQNQKILLSDTDQNHPSVANSMDDTVYLIKSGLVCIKMYFTLI